MAHGLGRKLCILSAAILLTVLFGLYVHAWLEALRAPLPIGYEGANLWIATQLANGKNIYDLNTLYSPPWSVTIYGPVYFCILAVFQKIFGLNYWSGRLISIVSLVVVVLYSYRLFRLSDLSKMLSGVVLCVFLSYEVIWNWSFLGRVDMLSMAFSVVALERFLAIYKSLERPRPIESPKLGSRDHRRKASNDTSGDGGKSFVDAVEIYIVPVLFCVLAIFINQPSVVVPAAITLFLLMKGRVGEALAFGGVSGFMCIALMMIINHATDHGFLQHMRYLSQTPFRMDELIEQLGRIGVDLIKIMIFPVLLVCWYMTRKKAADDLYISLPAILTVLAGGFALYTLGANHAFHFFFALSWLSGHLARSLPVESGLTLCAASAAMVLIIWFISFDTERIAFFANMHAPMADTVRKLKSMRHPGAIIFTEDPVLAMEMGARPLFVDVATFVQVWKGNGGSMKEVIDAIQKKKYAAVIINDQDFNKKEPYFYWSTELIDVIRSNYRMKERILGNKKPHDYCLPMQ